MENITETQIHTLKKLQQEWSEYAEMLSPVDAQIAIGIEKTIKILIDQIEQYVEDQNEYIQWLARKNR